VRRFKTKPFGVVNSRDLLPDSKALRSTVGEFPDETARGSSRAVVVVVVIVVCDCRRSTSSDAPEAAAAVGLAPNEFTTARDGLQCSVAPGCSHATCRWSRRRSKVCRCRERSCCSNRLKQK
jgi:hypothetical protein